MMTMRQMVERIAQNGEAALLEQLAEECLELGHAALKRARVIRGENPTPVTAEEAKQNLTEEPADVELCLDVYRQGFGLDTDDVLHFKAARWAVRLEKAEER